MGIGLKTKKAPATSLFRGLAVGVLSVGLVLGCVNQVVPTVRGDQYVEPTHHFLWTQIAPVSPSVAPRASLKPKATTRPTPRPTIRPKPTVAPPTRSISGIASWYCKAGVSVCHHSYPPGSMVAAACGKLRQAMGANWRGKMVTVYGNGRSVRVQLVDWCGSTTKLIDLYAAAFSKLVPTSAGTVSVRITW